MQRDFVIIDRLISRKLPTMRSSHEVDLLWDFFNQRISSVLSDQMEIEVIFEVLGSLKEQLVVFVCTKKSFALATDLIEALIRRLFRSLSRSFANHLGCPFLEALNDDDDRPMQLKDVEAYAEVLELGSSPVEKEVQTQPPMLPFSSAYPFCYKELRNCIKLHRCFFEDLQYYPREIDGVLQTVVDSVSVNVLCKHLEDRLLRSSSRDNW
jgi:hypothetical protein